MALVLAAAIGAVALPAYAISLGNSSSLGVVPRNAPFFDNPLIIQTLTPGSTVTMNIALGTIGDVTPTGPFTFACPIGMVPGGSYQLRVYQDATGSRTWTPPACFHWDGNVAGVLSTAPRSYDVVSFKSSDGQTASARITNFSPPS